MVFHDSNHYVTQQFQHSGFENEWRTNNFRGRCHNDWSGCFSNFSYRLARAYEIREGELLKVRRLQS